MWKQRELLISFNSHSFLNPVSLFSKLLNQIFRMRSKSNGGRELMFLAAGSIGSELGSC